MTGIPIHHRLLTFKPTGNFGEKGTGCASITI